VDGSSRRAEARLDLERRFAADHWSLLKPAASVPAEFAAFADNAAGKPQSVNAEHPEQMLLLTQD